MDQAIILSPSLAARGGAKEQIGRRTVYLGDEFCVHKQPSFADFAALKKLTGKPPVLLSTLLTENAFEGYARLLAECAKKAPGTEIVVNDIGLLRFIDKKYRGRFSLTLGRLMTYFFDTKHTRLPGCSRPILWSSEESRPAQSRTGQYSSSDTLLSGDESSPETQDGLGETAPSAERKNLKKWETRLDVTPMAYIKDFIKRYDIKRVETDSRELFNKYAGNTKVKISFHYPLRLMSMTRFCPFMGGIATTCKAPCADSLLSLKTMQLDFAVFSKGNAYFARNRLVRNPRLDRAVFLPFTPKPGFRLAMNKYSTPDRP